MFVECPAVPSYRKCSSCGGLAATLQSCCRDREAPFPTVTWGRGSIGLRVDLN